MNNKNERMWRGKQKRGSTTFLLFNLPDAFKNSVPRFVGVSYFSRVRGGASRDACVYACVQEGNYVCLAGFALRV